MTTGQLDRQPHGERNETQYEKNKKPVQVAEHVRSKVLPPVILLRTGAFLPGCYGNRLLDRLREGTGQVPTVLARTVVVIGRVGLTARPLVTTGCVVVHLPRK